MDLLMGLRQKVQFPPGIPDPYCARRVWMMRVFLFLLTVVCSVRSLRLSKHILLEILKVVLNAKFTSEFTSRVWMIGTLLCI